MKKLSTTEAELEKSVAYKKSVQNYRQSLKLKNCSEYFSESVTDENRFQQICTSVLILNNYSAILALILSAMGGGERGRRGGGIETAADSFVCCGSIWDFEKVKFSENS